MAEKGKCLSQSDASSSRRSTYVGEKELTENDESSSSSGIKNKKPRHPRHRSIRQSSSKDMDDAKLSLYNQENPVTAEKTKSTVSCNILNKNAAFKSNEKVDKETATTSASHRKIKSSSHDDKHSYGQTKSSKSSHHHDKSKSHKRKKSVNDGTKIKETVNSGDKREPDSTQKQNKYSEPKLKPRSHSISYSLAKHEERLLKRESTHHHLKDVANDVDIKNTNESIPKRRRSSNESQVSETNLNENRAKIRKIDEINANGNTTMVETENLQPANSKSYTDSIKKDQTKPMSPHHHLDDDANDIEINNKSENTRRSSNNSLGAETKEKQMEENTSKTNLDISDPDSFMIETESNDLHDESTNFHGYFEDGRPYLTMVLIADQTLTPNHTNAPLEPPVEILSDDDNDNSEMNKSGKATNNVNVNANDNSNDSETNRPHSINEPTDAEAITDDVSNVNVASHQHSPELAIKESPKISSSPYNEHKTDVVIENVFKEQAQELDTQINTLEQGVKPRHHRSRSRSHSNENNVNSIEESRDCEQTIINVDLDETSLSSNDVNDEDPVSSRTKSINSDCLQKEMPSAANIVKASPSWPKPSPNLTEFLSRLNKPISPQPFQYEDTSAIMDETSDQGSTMVRKKRRVSIAFTRKCDHRKPESVFHHTSTRVKAIRRRRATIGSNNRCSSAMAKLLIDEFLKLKEDVPNTAPVSFDTESKNTTLTMPVVEEALEKEDKDETVSKLTNDSDPELEIKIDECEGYQSYIDDNVLNTTADITKSLLEQTPTALTTGTFSGEVDIGENSGIYGGNTVFATPDATASQKRNTNRRRSIVGGKNRQQQLMSAKDDFFKKPFEYGWKRELVWRSNIDSTSKADVYFVSPGGKKLRSRSDIAPLLTGDLKVEHFCFIREPQGVGPEYELVRNAKSSRRPSTLPTTIETHTFGVVNYGSSMPTPPPGIVMGKRISKPKAPKGASPPPEGWTAVRALRSNNAALSQRMTHIGSSHKASPAFQAGQGNINNALNNSSVSSHNKQHELLNMNYAATQTPTIITNGSIKGENSITALTHPQSLQILPQLHLQQSVAPQYQELQQSLASQYQKSLAQRSAVITNDSIVKTPKVKSKAMKPVPKIKSKPSQVKFSTAPLEPIVVPIAETSKRISDKEQQELLTSIECVVCQSRLRSMPLSDQLDPNKRCEKCSKRLNNIARAKILSTAEAAARKEKLSSQEIVVVSGKKFLSVEDFMETGVLQPIEQESGMRSKLNNIFEIVSKEFLPPKEQKSPIAAETTDTAATNENTTGNELPKPIENDIFSQVAKGYETALCLMKNLMLPERSLLAKCCKLFNIAHNDSRIWQSVTLRNTYISDWYKFSKVLQKNSTRVLDMRKLIQKSGHQRNEMWRSFAENIGNVRSLETLILPRCSSRVVDTVFEHCKNLSILSASSITDARVAITHMKNLTQMRELRLHSSEPAEMFGTLEDISVNLKDLTILSLKNIRNLQSKNVASLILPNLQILELGDCSEIIANDLVTALQAMQSLRRLRLEFGMIRETPAQAQTPTTFSISTLLNGIQTLKSLNQLELINVDIKPGFDFDLAKCVHIKKLLIIPTYVQQSATTNQIIMNAVHQIPQNQLEVLTWGFTMELLRVTALYNEKESKKKKQKPKPNNIPVLRPVPGDSLDKLNFEKEAFDPKSNIGTGNECIKQQIQIVHLQTVEKIVRQALPQTKFTILKSYFANTWKQQLIE